MGALDELLAKWRENPDAGTTLALCTYLGTSRSEDLVREVGSTAEAWHKDDPQVMLAVGRMYLDAGLLQESQAALVVAGKIAPSEAAPYRYLGEVLLRRGDATRAEKVLARALQLGASEADTRMWHDRAVVYVPLQKRVGMESVAEEIARTIPKKTSIPPPTLGSAEADRLATTSPARLSPLAAGRAPAAALVPAGGARGTPLPPPPRMPGDPRDEIASEDEIPTGRFGPEDLLLARGIHAEEIATEQTSLAAIAQAMKSEPPPRLPPAPGRIAAPLPPPPVLPPSRPPPPLAVGARPTAPEPVARSSEGVFDDSPRPSPETVLEHLARVGLFERGGGAPPAWVAPARERPRGAWVFAGAIVLAAGAGYGAFAYVHKVRTERMATARRIEAEVKKLLETARVDDLKKTDDKLSSVFELDSRSEQAALLWLQNRVLSALMLPGEPRGIESALARCKTLGIDDAKTAYGKLASFLSEGDLAGAAAVLPKWDEKAKGDAFYHLAAGALLERAGDMRAIGRYQQAFDLDAELLPARLFHAALATLELGIATGKPSIDEAVRRLGDAPSARALSALAWAVDPAAPEELPESAKIAPADRDKLPTQLLAIPFVVDARLSARAGHAEEALAALDKGLRVTATPAVASFIGQVAIDLGDEQLARQATLRALSYSALYPRARSLAARVALLGARLDEAKKAIQELDAKSPEVAVVRAAAAYEALDASELESAVSALGGPDGPGRALSRGVDLTMGQKLPSTADLEAMAVPSVPWGDLIAVDAALDTGNVAFAEKVAGRWGERATTPTYALRRARLLRYLGKAADATSASSDALVPGGVTARVLVERFECLVAGKDVKGARDLLSQYPAVLGPMTDYLKVTVDAVDGKAARGKVLAARLEPAPAGSPVLYELIAAEAFTSVGDRRAKPLVQSLYRKLPRHPDVAALAKAVGIAR